MRIKEVEAGDVVVMDHSDDSPLYYVIAVKGVHVWVESPSDMGVYDVSALMWPTCKQLNKH